MKSARCRRPLDARSKSGCVCTSTWSAEHWLSLRPPADCTTSIRQSPPSACSVWSSGCRGGSVRTDACRRNGWRAKSPAWPSAGCFAKRSQPDPQSQDPKIQILKSSDSQILNFREEQPQIPRQRYLISTNSSIPYFDPSRPSPDSLTPPNGATSVEIRPVLIPTMPYSSASATRQMRPMSRP